MRHKKKKKDTLQGITITQTQGYLLILASVNLHIQTGSAGRTVSLGE